MKRTTYPAHRSTQYDWETVFEHPAPITLHTLETGHTTVPLSGMLNLKHPAAKSLANKRISVPVYAHLIRHERFGDYLIDCGLDTSYQHRPYGRVKGLLARFIIGESNQNKGQDVASYLHANQIRLAGAFLTHMHFDHIAGIVDLPPDTKYIANKEEPYLNIPLLYYGDHLRQVDTLSELDIAQGTAMPILGPCLDLFGDGSLWAISTPGHTRGHTSFLVNQLQRPTVIAGDACAMQESLDLGVGPGSYSTDRELAQESLDKLRAFAKQYPQVTVHCGHAPANAE